MKKHYRKENDCLNCRTTLQGHFCHVCGQENLQIKESFGHMMNHAISDYFHFDYQFFHTLKPLFFKPGKLTIDYLAGRRVQYLHPVKMYIFISLVYFLVLFRSGFEPVNVTSTSTTTTTTKSVPQKEVGTKSKALDSVINKPIASAPASGNTAKNTTKNNIHFFGNNTDSKDTTYQQYLASQQNLPENKKDGFFMRHIRKREFELNTNKTDIIKLLQEGVRHDTPKLMFLLLPLFALILKIAFWKNKKYYVEHLIYAFHLHCFLFLFLTIITLLKMGFAFLPGHAYVDTVLNFSAVTIIIWYLYRSFRVVYNRPRGKTILKMIGISVSYALTIGIAMLSLFVIVVLFG